MQPVVSTKIQPNLDKKEKAPVKEKQLVSPSQANKPDKASAKQEKPKPEKVEKPQKPEKQDAKERQEIKKTEKLLKDSEKVAEEVQKGKRAKGMNQLLSKKQKPTKDTKLNITPKPQMGMCVCPICGNSHCKGPQEHG